MAFAELGQGERAWEVLQLVSPIHRTLTPQAVATYRVEPYVVAADVLANAAHLGRGGWTWYTGSAGWMYRLILESLLGLQRTGTRLRFRPCLPPDWPGFRLHYRYHATRYVIELVRHADVSGEPRVTLDGVDQPTPEVPLTDDRVDHAVTVQVARR
jgi:cellobiose phosphorylase